MSPWPARGLFSRRHHACQCERRPDHQALGCAEGQRVEDTERAYCSRAGGGFQSRWEEAGILLAGPDWANLVGEQVKKIDIRTREAFTMRRLLLVTVLGISICTSGPVQAQTARNPDDSKKLESEVEKLRKQVAELEAKLKEGEIRGHLAKSKAFGHSKVILAVAFSKDGKLLATASKDDTRLWDVSSSK